MLEDLAYSFISLPERVQNAAATGLFVLGAVLAGATVRSAEKMGRATYFVAHAGIYFAARAFRVHWLLTADAYVGGFLWALFLLEGVVYLGVGYFYAKIAMARSRDAFGHGRMAMLAFVPLANFWLMFAPPKQPPASEPSAEGAAPPGKGAMAKEAFAAFAVAAVLTGLGNMAARFYERQIEYGVADAAYMYDSDADYLAAQIRRFGLETMLAELASDSGAPEVIDEVTTIMRIEADGVDLRRFFVVRLTPDVVDAAFRRQTIDWVCGFDYFAPLLDAGARFHEIFDDPQGVRLAEVVVDQSVCDG